MDDRKGQAPLNGQRFILRPSGVKFEPAHRVLYHGLLFQRLMVMVDDCFNQFDPLGHSSVRQEYQSGVDNSAQVDQFSEVLVDGDQNPVF